jgi:hypothetical protein
VYRREAGAETSFDGERRRFPTLYVTEKIRHKAGLVFLNCPHFKKLRESTPVYGPGDGGPNRDEYDDLSSKGRLKLKTLNKKAEEYDEKEKKLKHKRKGKKKDPSINEVKKILRKIIKYHERKVKELIPSIYPLIGPANSDSENEEDSKKTGTRDDKREHTKREIKNYNIL